MKDKWFYAITEKGVLWLDGIHKRKPPVYANKIPFNFEGWLHVHEDGTISIFTKDWKPVKQSRRKTKDAQEMK